MDSNGKGYVAFLKQSFFAAGSLLQIALEVKKQFNDHHVESLLIFEEATGRQIDIDVSGNETDLAKRFEIPKKETESLVDSSTAKKRGRPKLGVIGREVTLLPKDWQWLDNQKGGASAALRRLVAQARRLNSHEDLVRDSQDKTNRFMSAIAGNLPGFEEATRALFARDQLRFAEETKQWPKDVRNYALKFSENAFTQG